MRRVFLAILFSLAVVVPAWADNQAGYDAYQRGDYAKALQEWLPLAEQGNAFAQNGLGVMCVNGWGIPKDNASALQWFGKAAEQGNVDAQFSLAVMYAQGLGIPGDISQSKKWLEKAAMQGHAWAQIGLGNRYIHGQGVPKDPTKGLRWKRIVAERGYASAQFSLSVIYGMGEYVPKDTAKAARWMRRAAEQGYADAQSSLGADYFSGTGVLIDDEEAFFWLSLAAANGSEIAAAWRSKPEKMLTFEQIAAVQERVRKWRPTKEQAEFSPASEIPFIVSSPLSPTAPSTSAAPTIDLVMAVQKRLSDLGYNPGPVDGAMGRKTRAAIKAFQRLAGLPTTGEVSEGLLQKINERAEVAEATPTQPPPPVQQPSQTALVPPGVDFGRYHALVIGNNAYRTLPRLETAISDARAVAATLRDSYGFDTTLVTDATRDVILDAMDGLRGRLTKNDNLLIYYAGHGWLDRKADRGYWQPVDATEGSRSRWVSNADISDTLKATDAKHVIVVADSCYSGTLARSNPRGIKIEPHAPDFITQMLGKKSRTVLASGGLEPVTDSGGGDHSVFAKALLDALTDNRGVIDGVQVFARVRQQVRLNAHQTPQYSNIRFAGHEVGGDFLFVRRR